ncbi:DNA-binding TFAR19-related protein PDSD5 family [Methanonatronarchaeum thermophilum]|uniref:DNA-binding protein AMET1_0042 n=1 Tax=Methanonatronarchaeum thermophilum TaxID=1927129 RepID=A0A1Y3GGD1_9EURY|nr:DNA-binding protein [Methanonatronarchaeum thermophilum]OUJ19373.1 DNA-binding TFAR19-related protein PDSD5 family [Methanonatronarchaeum thermophilum]
MDEEELKKLREKKLQEMQERGGQDGVSEEQEQEIENRKKQILRQIMTPEARQRLKNLSMVKPEFTDSIQQQLIMIAQSGRIQGKIDDNQLKEILKKAQQDKNKDINIRRK